MLVRIQMKVFDDNNYPVYVTEHTIEDPQPTTEFEGVKIYDFGFKYAEPAQPIWLRKPEIKTEKAGEFSTKINQDLGILGE